MLSAAPITTFLLAVNVLVSLHALFVDPGALDRYAFRPVEMRERKEWYRMITGAFLHANLVHLLFNMMTLYFFGPYLEARRLGELPFLVVYFGSLLAAHAYAYVRHRNDPDYAAVGASGAISGVLLSFCLFEPMSPIYIFLIPVGIPAILFAVLFIAFSSYAVRDANRGGGGRIAHDAHLGGAIAGLVLTIILSPSVLRIFVAQLPF